MGLVEGREQVFVPRNRLRRSQEQQAVFGQGVMEGRNHLRLEIGIQIDQQVAAGNQIDPRKRRIANDAVHRKCAEIPNPLGDDVVSINQREEPFEPRGFESAHQRRRITTRSRQVDRGVVYVCREDLKARRIWQHVHVFDQQNGERIGLFSRGASGYPNPYARLCLFALEQLGYRHARDCVERRGVTKELRHSNQKFVEEEFDFL